MKNKLLLFLLSSFGLVASSFSPSNDKVKINNLKKIGGKDIVIEKEENAGGGYVDPNKDRDFCFSATSSLWIEDGENLATPDFFNFDRKTGEITLGDSLDYIKGNSSVTFAFQFTDTPFTATNPFEAYVHAYHIGYSNFYYDNRITSVPSTNTMEFNNKEVILKYIPSENIIGLTYTPLCDSTFELLDIKFKTSKTNRLVNASIYSGAFDGIKYFNRDIINPKVEIPADANVLSDTNTKIEFTNKPHEVVEPLKLLSKVFFYSNETGKYYRALPINDSLVSFARQTNNITPNKDYFLDVEFNVEGKKIQHQIQYKVIDNTPPEIRVVNVIKDNLFRYSYSKALTEIDLQNLLATNFEIYDHEHKKTFSPQILLTDFEPFLIDTFPFKVIGSDGQNQAEWNGFVELIDDIAPVIKGPKTITTNTSKILSSEDILTLFSSHDDIDKSEVTLGIEEDSYHVGRNSVTKGKYNLTIVSSDKSGNTSSTDVVIDVEESQDSYWYIVESKLHMVEGTKISAKELIRRMIDEGLIQDLNFKSASYIGDMSLDGTQKEGTYSITLRAETEEGIFKYLNLNVVIFKQEKEETKTDEEIEKEEVKKEETEKKPQTNTKEEDKVENKEEQNQEANPPSSNETTPPQAEEKENGFVAFFKNLWIKICSFFKNLFNPK